MSFVLKMVARELRASWRRLLFFFVCVAIGVGAIVALRSIIQSLRYGLTREARAMIASDVIVQTSRAWTPSVRGRVENILSSAPIVARVESIETPTMVRAEQGNAVARMVELRGVEAAFPFYGTLTLADGQSYSHALVAGRGAVVGPELLAQLGIRLGDRLMIATLLASGFPPPMPSTWYSCGEPIAAMRTSSRRSVSAGRSDARKKGPFEVPPRMRTQGILVCMLSSA